MNMRHLPRLAAALLATVALAGCLDIEQKILVEKGELAYTAEIRVDAKLASMSEKKGGFCGEFGSLGGEAVLVQVNQTMTGGNVVCTLSAKGPLEKFATFAAGEKETPLVSVSRASEGAWRIDSSFDLKSKAGESGMDGMMEAMLAGRTLSWTVQVPKVLETNGQLSQDGKAITWSVPLASAYKQKQSFYVIFKAERPWYAFITDLIGGVVRSIKNLFASIFGGSDKAPAPAAAPAAPAAPAQAPAPAAAAEADKGAGQETNNEAEKDADKDAAKAGESQGAKEAQSSGAAKAAEADTGPITASFDCAKAGSAQERMICGDRDLARLDVALSAAYRKARESAADPKALQAEQLQWLKSSRNACGDKACMAEAYNRRLAQLNR